LYSTQSLVGWLSMSRRAISKSMKLCANIFMKQIMHESLGTLFVYHFYTIFWWY
jgi:hypothetical protein